MSLRNCLLFIIWAIQTEVIHEIEIVSGLSLGPLLTTIGTGSPRYLRWVSGPQNHRHWCYNPSWNGPTTQGQKLEYWILYVYTKFYQN